MPKQNQPAKETLDQQTSYFTFLPHMNEGFHIGYHPAPGVVCDRNQRPREWLESLARYMQTPGTDVGFSIPDVLAGEQQLRRMARLDPAEADRRQPMTDWRALLALLLLWDMTTAGPCWSLPVWIAAIRPSAVPSPPPCLPAGLPRGCGFLPCGGPMPRKARFSPLPFCPILLRWCPLPTAAISASCFHPALTGIKRGAGWILASG